MARPSLVLLDACVVIATHELGVWEELVGAVEITLPDVIAAESRFFVDPKTGLGIDIRLEEFISSGKIRVASTTPSELTDLQSQFDRVFLQRMHDGEAEALAILLAGRLPDHLFCTGDGPAIRALALLDMSEQGVSLETLLQKIGLGRRVPLAYREVTFQQRLKEGKIQRIQGIGLSPNSRFRV